MEESRQPKFDLENRTLQLSKACLALLRKFPKDSIIRNLTDQCSRACTSIGANYREANEAESKKEFAYRLKVCKKECKETIYWLALLKETNSTLNLEIESIENEVVQLMKIFGAIIERTKKVD